MKRLLWLCLFFAGSAWAQTALTTTTLTFAVNGGLQNSGTVSALQNQVVLGSLTNVYPPPPGAGGTSNVRSVLFVDREMMAVLAVNQPINSLSNTVTVQRGFNGSNATPHNAGATVYVGTPDQFFAFDPSGACVAAATRVTPWINFQTGNQWTCTAGLWTFSGGPYFGGGGSGLPAGCTGTTGQITCSVFATNNNNGGISATEGTGANLTAASGVDLLWADSTAHRWKANVNNGGAQTVAFLSDISNVTASALTFHMVANVICCASGTTFNANNTTGIAAAGTVSSILPSGNEHFMLQAASGTTSGNQAGWSPNTQGTWFTGRNLYFSAYVKDANSDLTNQILWVGMGTTNVIANYNTNTIGSVTSFMGFRFSSTASDTDWQCVTGNGTSQTTTDSGVAANVTSGHFFAVQWISASSVVFSIDGTQVCNNTTNVPAINTQMGEVELITTQTAAAKNIQMAWQATHMDY